MLQFAKALYYPLNLTSLVILSSFSMSPLGPQLQLEQLQFKKSSRSFSLLVLVRCNCSSFPVLSTKLFCPRHSNINKMTLSFSFSQYNFVRFFVLKDMVCMDNKTPQNFDLVIFNYTYRFVIIPLNLAN